LSKRPHGSDAPDRLLPPRGDYQTLLSYEKCEVIYEITFRFCQKFLAKGDRTVDQMVQAARSGNSRVSGNRSCRTAVCASA